MHINYLAIIIAAVAQFIIGAIWYMPLFGNLWGKIHGMEKVSKEDRQKMMKSMGPFLALQFLVDRTQKAAVAVLGTVAIVSLTRPRCSNSWCLSSEKLAKAMAAFFWVGFVVPTQVSGVIFGGTNPKWIVAKILVQAGASFLCLEVAAAIIWAML